MNIGQFVYAKYKEVDSQETLSAYFLMNFMLEEVFRNSFTKSSALFAHKGESLFYAGCHCHCIIYEVLEHAVLYLTNYFLLRTHDEPKREQRLGAPFTEQVDLVVWRLSE